jgi:Capsule assembly protein Wzi/PAP2 superfamily
MKKTSVKTSAICSGLLMAMVSLGATCLAQSQAQEHQPMIVTPASSSAAGPEAAQSVELIPDFGAGNSQKDADEFTESRPGLSLLKNIALDQKSIWTSPSRLRWSDGSWLLPLAAVTGGLLATDRAVPPALSTDPNKLNRYVKVSDSGLYSLIGAGGGLYVWGKLSHNDHQKETGILAGEAAINSFAVDTALKYSFGRERPNQGQGLGNLFQHGVSFPSDHSAVAWSIASVIAHEYPGPLTKLIVYGLASAVSVSRVGAKEHFPSDVLVGSAVGWLIGRQVYRAHHDPELGGAGLDSFFGNEDGEGERDRHNMGSTFVPLDSWVYAAFERLAALRYINTEIMGLKPWTRIECARLSEEAGEALQQNQAMSEEAARLQSRLAKEFAYEIGLLDGGRNFTANLDSLYARAVSISGPALTDGFHFGQTVSYDFGRPFERGTNAQVGGSFHAAAGPLAVYVRAEYQHAPSAPALSSAIVNFISAADGGVAIGGLPVPVSRIPAGPVSPVNRPRLLDAYVTVNMNNWQLVLGKQSLSWAPGPDSMMWSDNVEPVNMARLVNPEPFYLPGFFRHIGPVQIDQFFGRLEGHPYVPRPFVFGQKLDFKPFSFLELGLGRRSVIGGKGGNPLTAHNWIDSYIGRTDPRLGSVPGDNESEMDWTFYVPKVRNYIVLYGDAYAEDDILPIENPARNPWHPGLYLTRIPGIPKLDFHIEGVSTEQAGLIPEAGGGNHGIFNYWNMNYQDGNTVNGNIIGNVVGRDGRTIQSWVTYWISPRDTLQILYRHNSVSSDFVPGGGAWQDYVLRSEMHFRGGAYVKAEVQVENISHYPLLFKGPQKNVTAILEVGFSSGERERQ